MSTRSPGRSEPSVVAAPAPGLDVYLMPAVVGGGLGDIAEVLDAGRCLAAAGFAPRLYRSPGRPLPPSVDGPWDWPPITAVDRIEPAHARALTVTPAFGVSAAPGRREAYGRAGPWAEEAEAIETRYGVDRTLHVSLEEFARSYSSAEEHRERYREGGAPAATVRRSSRTLEGAAERVRWVRAFRRFRALDRPNVLHLLGTFEPAPGFQREFPEIVQVGPLWPGTYRTGPRPAPGPARSLLWYASPSSAARIVGGVVRGAGAAPAPVGVAIRSPHPLVLPPMDGVRVEALQAPMPTRLWRRRFSAAGLRIVTGSRSLLEALELGGPFLYFNGVLVPRGRPRRHRPEKVQALLRLLARLGTPPALRRDLAAFSRGQRVAEIVGRALSDPDWWRGFPSGAVIRAATRPALGDVLVRVAREAAAGRLGTTELVARARAGNRRRSVGRRSKV